MNRLNRDPRREWVQGLLPHPRSHQTHRGFFRNAKMPSFPFSNRKIPRESGIGFRCYLYRGVDLLTSQVGSKICKKNELNHTQRSRTGAEKTRKKWSPAHNPSATGYASELRQIWRWARGSKATPSTYHGPPCPAPAHAHSTPSRPPLLHPSHALLRPPFPLPPTPQRSASAVARSTARVNNKLLKNAHKIIPRGEPKK